MKKYFKKNNFLQNNWKRALFSAVVIVGLLAVLHYYFYSYSNPYLQKNVVNISDNWQYYSQNDPQVKTMERLTRINNPADNTLYFSRRITEEVPGATLMTVSHHQVLRFRLDGELIYQVVPPEGQKNPGMSLHFIPLPAGYAGKTLMVEITSPYDLFSGFPQDIFLGDMVSLEAMAHSTSTFHTAYLFICLALGIVLIVLGVASNFLVQGSRWTTLFLGIFSIMWGISYVGNDYSTLHFFSPLQSSNIVLGVQVSYFFPLMLFLYSQAQYTRKYMRWVVVASGISAGVGVFGKLFGLIDIPDVMFYTNFVEQASFLTVIVLALVSIFKYKREIKAYEILWVPNAVMWALLVISYYTNWLPLYIVNDIYLQTYFILILAICGYNIYAFYKSFTEQGTEIDMLENKNQMALESYETMREHLEQTGVLRHEINNQLLVLQAMLEQAEYTKAEEYIDSLSLLSKRAQNPLYCDNYIINVILVSKLANIPEEELRVSTNIAVPPKLAIQENDLSSLLLNIIDNALEACYRVPDQKRRWLAVSIRLQGTYLYIKVENSKAEPIVERENRIVTSKRDEKIHGYGIRIVEAITEKYDGMMSIDYDDSSFSVQTALKNQIPDDSGSESQGLFGMVFRGER